MQKFELAIAGRGVAAGRDQGGYINFVASQVAVRVCESTSTAFGVRLGRPSCRVIVIRTR